MKIPQVFTLIRDFFFLNNLLLLPRFMRFALGVNKKSANYSVVSALLSRAASQT